MVKPVIARRSVPKQSPGVTTRLLRRKERSSQWHLVVLPSFI